jgi:uncharacterized damage-inducible protein DinB
MAGAPEAWLRGPIAAARTVGRHALPTNVIGLLFHLAEHTQRHTGQVITTAKIVRAVGAPRD